MMPGRTIVKWAAAAARTPALFARCTSGGRTPAEAVNASPGFPELFANQYTSGEISGKLDETLRRLHQYYQDEGSRKLHAVAQWTPRAVYFFIMMMIAVYVVRFWTGYFKQIGDVIKF